MDITALKDSWRDVEQVGDEAVQYFYSHLFINHPEVRSMFPVYMATQRNRFFTALGRIVSNVDTLSSDPSFVQQLGRDHRKFEVTAEHYPAAGASLLATLGHFLGAKWTDDLAQTWTDAFGAVANIMVIAAEDAEAAAPAWWDAEVIASQRRSVDVAVHTLQPDQPYPFAPGQSIAVEIPQRPRLWRYYSPANAPRADGTIDLHVQIVAGGQVSSAFARQVTVGSQVKLGAPIGRTLAVDAGNTANLLLVAGGTGLAPLRAIIEQVDTEWQKTGFAPEVHLFHGARTAWNLYDHHTLVALRDRPWLSYTPVISDDPNFRGARGLVGPIAAQSRDWSGFKSLVCGSPDMVRNTVRELAAAGLPRAAIQFEEFGDFASVANDFRRDDTGPESHDAGVGAGVAADSTASQHGINEVNQWT